jgi:hypothetical protein
MWGMKNRFQVPGVRGQGRKSRCQVLGFRIQDSGVRSQKSGVRMESIWSPPTAYCLLSTAYSGRMWQVGNQNHVQGAKGWGLGDEGLRAADACQHHLLNLSCRPRKPCQPRKRILFDGPTRQCY